MFRFSTKSGRRFLGLGIAALVVAPALSSTTLDTGLYAFDSASLLQPGDDDETKLEIEHLRAEIAAQIAALRAELAALEAKRSALENRQDRIVRSLGLRRDRVSVVEPRRARKVQDRGQSKNEPIRERVIMKMAPQIAVDPDHEVEIIINGKKLSGAEIEGLHLGDHDVIIGGMHEGDHDQHSAPHGRRHGDHDVIISGLPGHEKASETISRILRHDDQGRVQVESTVRGDNPVQRRTRVAPRIETRGDSHGTIVIEENGERRVFHFGDGDDDEFAPQVRTRMLRPGAPEAGRRVLRRTMKTDSAESSGTCPHCGGALPAPRASSSRRLLPGGAMLGGSGSGSGQILRLPGGNGTVEVIIAGECEEEGEAPAMNPELFGGGIHHSEMGDEIQKVILELLPAALDVDLEAAPKKRSSNKQTELNYY